MLSIRLQRVGRRNRPNYRVLVLDKKTSPKSNKYIEKVGFYDPILKTSKFDAERIKYWISKGAKTSDSLTNLLISEKILEGKKINVLPKKTVQKKEEKDVKDTEKKSEAKTEEKVEVEESNKEEKVEEKVEAEESNKEEKTEDSKKEGGGET